MPRFAGQLLGMGFGTEVIYSFVIIACSLMVYFATKELDELSSYKGINYFRKAFLFFALAYFFRTLIKFILVFFNIPRILEFSPKFLGPISLFLFMYFSSIAIFYLLYSVVWKKMGINSKGIYFFQILAYLDAHFFRIGRSGKRVIAKDFHIETFCHLCHGHPDPAQAD